MTKRRRAPSDCNCYLLATTTASAKYFNSAPVYSDVRHTTCSILTRRATS